MSNPHPKARAFTEEQKRAVADRVRAQWANPEYRARVVARMREAGEGRRQTPEQRRENNRANMRAKRAAAKAAESKPSAPTKNQVPDKYGIIRKEQPR